MHKRCLYLSAHLCAPDFPAAGHKLAASRLHELSGICDQIDVVTFRDNQSADRVRDYANVDYHIFNLSKQTRILGALRYPWLPIAASSRKYLADKLVRRLLRSYVYDFIYVDFSQTLELVPSRFRAMATVRVHDVFSQLYRRQIGSARGLRKLIGIIEYVRVKIWEPRLLSEAGGIVALNDKDRDIVGRMTGVANVGVSYPDPNYYVTDRTLETITPGLLLFWGNMSRMENIDAAEYFISQIFSLVAAAVPHAHVVIAGANPPQRILRLANNKVTITGYVEDPGDLFRRCDVAVVPLRQGAGIKIKVLELIKSGVPTIATTIGAEGIAGCTLLEVHDDIVPFADACIRLLSRTWPMDTVSQS